MLCGLDVALYFGPCFYGERLEFQSIDLGLKAGPVGLSLYLISRVLEDFSLLGLYVRRRWLLTLRSEGGVGGPINSEHGQASRVRVAKLRTSTLA